MAESGGSSDPGGRDENKSVEGKKTLSQGIQLLPLLIRFFKNVGLLLGVWVLGYFRFSSTWVMVGLLCHMLNEEYRKIKDAKKRFAHQAVANEKEAILARCEELPSWVYFPDVERAEWLNKVLRQMWPYIGVYTRNLLQTSVQLSVTNSLPASLKPFKFEKVDLGDIPPRIGGVKVYADNVKRDEIFLDMEIFFASDTEITMTVRGMPVGIKDLQIHGTLRVVMKPLVSLVPFIGGVNVFFLNQPCVDFDLTNLANVLDMPLLSNTLRSIIIEQIGYYMVLPNKISYPLVQGVDLQALKYPLPAGVVRFHVVAARDLKAADIGIGKSKNSDPYLKLYVGSKKFKTKVIKDSLNPSWNQFFEAVVDQKHGQYAEVEVFDEDTGEDDELGVASLDIQNIANTGIIDTWLPLENVKTGMIHVRAMWMHLSMDPADLDRAVEASGRQRRECGGQDSLASALVVVTLDSAKNLPRSKKSLSEPLPLARLTIGQDAQQSPPAGARTTNPKWEANFHYLINDPRDQNLLVQLVDSAKSERKLGWVSVPLHTLLSCKEMTSEQELPLRDSGPTSAVRLRLAMRVLSSVRPADWASDSVHKEPTSAAAEDEEGTSVDAPETQPQASPEEAPAPAAPAAPAPVGAEEPAEEEEIVLRSEASSGLQTSPTADSLRQRTNANVSSSSEGSLGRIQITIRYSQPRAKLVVAVHKCVNLVAYDEDNLSDPYVRLYLLPDKTKKKTAVIKDDLNPVFDETFDWSMTMSEASSRTLEVSVKNKNSMFSKARHHMGVVRITLAQLDLTQAHTQWYPLEEPEDTD